MKTTVAAHRVEIIPALLSSLLLVLIIELSTGLTMPKYPCGVCEKAVKWSDKGIACDACETWFHTRCIGMCDEIYFSQAPDISWNCFQCGIPNFSTTLFAVTPAESTLPPSLANLTHETSASSSATSAANDSCSPRLNSSIPKTLNAPAFASSPLGTSQPKDTSVSSISSISSAPDPLLDLPNPVRHNQSLRTLVINFQGIRNKKHDFWNLIESCKPDIIIGNETFLKPEIRNSEIFPPTFDAYRKDRNDNSGWGGVFIATRKSLITHQIPCDKNAEAVLVSIQTQTKGSNLIIGSLYRPPNKTSDEYTTSMLKVIDQACHSKKDIVWLGGDLNLRDINWNNGNIESNFYPKAMNQMYISKFKDNDLFQSNEQTTRGDSLLDLFFTNRPSLHTRTCTLPPLGDHDIIMTDNNICPARIKPQPRVVHIWKKANVAGLKKDLEDFSKELTEMNTEETVDSIWSKINTALSEAIHKHVPTKILSPKPQQPWINQTIKRLSRRKNRAWRKAKTTGRKEDWQRFKFLQKQTRRACRRSYSDFVSGLINDDGDRNLWRYIKSKRCDSHGVSPLKKDGLTFSDSKTKANILNEQFCSVFTQENLSTLPDLGESPHPDMPEITVTIQGIVKLLKNLNPSKAAGPDKIPCRLLVFTAQEIAPAITHLFSLSLKSGEIPDAWRHALVQPVFKKGDRSCAANYRPISLTSVICKLLEHVIRSSMTSHFDRNNILVTTQHGFRKNRSCETQLILTVDDLASTIDEGGQTDTILLDFS